MHSRSIILICFLLILISFLPVPTLPLCHLIMKNETETRPFLEYSDDPAGSGELGGGVNAQSPEATKRTLCSSRLARDLLIFFVASLLWLGAIFFLLPWPTSSGTWHSNHGGGKGGSKSLQSGAGDYRLYNITSNAHFVTCGNSTVEAQRKGCRYDPLLNHWVPAACIDQEWIDEYKDDDSWTAFAEYVYFLLPDEKERNKAKKKKKPSFGFLLTNILV